MIMLLKNVRKMKSGINVTTPTPKIFVYFFIIVDLTMLSGI